MMQPWVRMLVCGAVATTSVMVLPATARCQVPQGVERPAQSPTTVVSQDARETRRELEAVLQRIPPTVGRVLRLDPSLLRNATYLAPYPSLAAFLQQHPEVANNPGYFLENVAIQLWYPPQPRDPQADAINMWRNTMEGLAMIIVFLIITSALIWLIRSVLEYRRWYRMSKVQAEVHNKLMDRFTSNEDLLAYMQTPVGQRFLESAPLPIEAPSRPAGAPLARILWSIQAGMVLAAGGLGLLFVSQRVIEEVSQVLFAVGVLALAIGVGFVVSAAASFLLSQRLGLLGSGTAREHSGPAGA